MKLIILMFFVYITLQFTGCSQGITWDPNAYMSSSDAAGIISDGGDFVSCEEPRFEDFACMSKEKWMELKTILKKARFRRTQQELIDYYTPKIDKAYKIQSE